MSLWPLAFGVAGAVAAAGTLAVPAARRAAFGSVAFDWQGRELEFDRIEPDNITVRLKSGAVMRAYRFAGLPYDTKPEAEQVALHEARGAVLHACAALGVTSRLFGVKRRRAVHHPATWPSPTLNEIGEAEASLYRNAYELRWFWTLQADDLNGLERADEKIMTTLAAYGPRRLARPADSDADCPLTGFLNFLVCGDLRDDLRAVSSDISANLPSADLPFEKTSGSLIIAAPTPLHHRIVAIREWPGIVSGHLLHDIMALPAEIEVSQVLAPYNRDLDVILLKRSAQNPLVAEMAAEECAAAVELLSSGTTSRLTTQMSFILRAPSEVELNTTLADVAHILADRRVVYSLESKGAPVVWFNRLPEHARLRANVGRRKRVKAERTHLLRPLKLFAENVAALWPFEASPSGLTASQFGKGPVRSFPTGSGQHYAFQFQCMMAAKALGNYLVFARWVTDGKGRAGLYAGTFNAPRDSLSVFLDRSFMVGINMNEALDDPNLGPPVVAHIGNAIERMAREGRTRGFAIFIDEAANLLRNPAFRDLAAVMYREYRKFGGAVGMAFQDPGALHKSGIADAVLENTASLFFFPNPQGSRAAYEPFNLNDEQKAFIYGAPEGRKVLLVKRDAATGFQESVILDIDLGPLGKALRFYRSGPDAVRDLLGLQEKWGDQWLAQL